MPKFRIVQKDPEPYKQKIIQFWNKYLPGTAHGRFDWMMNGNPAGPANWFFAFSDQDEDLAGTISVMPIIIRQDGRPVRAGILGDLMIGEKYRVFGPALQLPKEVLQRLSDLNMDFVYTVPNPASTKLIQKVGMKKLLQLKFFVRPVDFSYYVQKLKPQIAKPLLRFAAPVCKMLSRCTYASTRTIREITIQEIDRFADRLDSLNLRIRKQCGFIGDKTAAYLKWRYFLNPQFNFILLGYMSDNSDDLKGYAVVSCGNEGFEIYDIISESRKVFFGLLNACVSIAQKNKVHALYSRLPAHSSVIKDLRSCFFFDGKEDFSVFFYGDYDKQGSFHFSSGDRNI